ncbi:PilZ domain-containing protein [Halobacteriovorax sp. GB3]|uniref:PilZ domain-containing protein n=1 Tax=Halobacteriovorax sp. GB3 TaxID=2719615 RepID=UPI00235F3C75|nr:PilZ domain-containing protein [Halobacteriovorax sp. GB3]MDD0852563.1 PilZ domain-containing protein [Halobacteriovorax sp. GB3]
MNGDDQGKKEILSEVGEIQEKLEEFAKGKRFFYIKTLKSNVSCYFESLKRDSFTVKLSKADEHVKFQSNSLYVFSALRNGIFYEFEAVCESVGPYIFHFSYPKEITITQKREYDRFEIHQMKNPSVGLVIDGEKYSYKLFDLSQGGLAFLVPTSVRDLFRQEQYLEFSKIGSKSFVGNVEGTIAHISEIRHEGDVYLKVGVQFFNVPSFDLSQ